MQLNIRFLLYQQIQHNKTIQHTTKLSQSLSKSQKFSVHLFADLADEYGFVDVCKAGVVEDEVHVGPTVVVVVIGKVAGRTRSHPDFSNLEQKFYKI